MLEIISQLDLHRHGKFLPSLEIAIFLLSLISRIIALLVIMFEVSHIDCGRGWVVSL
jgi:hypothetical protein